MKLKTQEKRVVGPVAHGGKRPPGARVMAHPRVTGGNHTQIGPRRAADKYEREADEVAAHAMRGGEHAAQTLTPAPAAPLQVPSSRGEPLPAALRQELETDLGAGLSAVRVHRDAAAGAAARSEDARAFASGQDIYFASGAYAPSNAAGRELLVHEVAHVLQQTGRRGSDERLHATDARGTGEVQRAGLEDAMAGFRLFVAPPSLSDVIARHQAEHPTDTGLVNHGRYLKVLLGDFRDKHPAAETLIHKTREKGFTKVPEHVALYYDCLKGLKKFRAATRLVRGQIPDKTAFGYNPFYTAVLRSSLWWLSGAMRRSALLSRYWPRLFVHTFRMYLYGPWRGVLNLGMKERFEDVFGAEIVAAREPTRLISNERTYYALAALKALDEFRKAILTKTEALLTPRVGRPLDLKYRIAAGLSAGGELERLGRQYDLPPETMVLLEATAPEIRKVAEGAVAFWDRVRELEQARQKGLSLDQVGPARPLIAEIKQVRAFRRLERQLLSVARGVFRLNRGRMLSPRAYQANLARQKRGLRALSFGYDQQLISLNDQAARGKPFDQKLALLYGWVLYLLDTMERELGRYSIEGDEKYIAENRDESRPREDVRIAHRIRTARWLYGAAAFLAYTDLQAVALRVLFPAQKDQRETFLALLGEWEGATPELAEFARDFPKQVRGLEPVTGRELIDFAYAGYFETLSNKLKGLLQEQGKDYSGAKGPIINQAVDQAKSFARPQRFRMKEYEAAVKPGDKGNFARFVDAHPKFRSFMQANLKPTQVAVIPDAYASHQEGIVFWLVPGMERLVQILRSHPGLNALVEAEMKARQQAESAKTAKRKPGQAAPPPIPDWQQWLRALHAVVRREPKRTAEAREQLVAHFRGKQQELDVLSRRASSHERRVRLGNHIKPLWQGYDPTDIKTFTKPNRALQLMTEFAGRVSPPRDQNLQMAALTLELAPVMYRKLGPQKVLLGLLKTGGTERFDIILSLLPHLVGTLALAGSAAARVQLENPDINLALEGTFVDHLRYVEKLRTQTQARQLAFQKEFALRGNAEGNSLSSPGHGYPVVPKKPFTVDGITYELIKVHKTFTYNPRMAVSAGGIEWHETLLGESRLKDSSGREIARADRKGSTLLEITRQGRGERTAVRIAVKDNDDHMLAELTHAVTMQAIIEQLRTLEEVIGVYMEILDTGISLIPGLGPPYMAARLVTSVLSFIASPQFDQLMTLLSGDGDQIMREALGYLESWAKPELLWEWLLFGRDLFPKLKLPKSADKQKHVASAMRMKTKSKERLSKIVSALANVGVKVGRAIRRLRDRIVYAVRRTQMFVLSTPIVATVLRFVVDNWTRLSGLRLADLGLGQGDQLAEGLIDKVQGLFGQVKGMLKTLQELALPKEIVPLEQIVELTLELVTDHLGGKYKVAVRVIRGGLEKIGAWKKIVDAITGRLKAAQLDPNIFWQRAVRDKLQGPLRSAGQRLSGALLSALKQVPFLGRLTGSEAPPIEFTFGEGTFPESQEYPSPKAQPLFAAALPAVPDAGQPLADEARADAARRFGHDFSHVRLHAGPVAGRITAALGVQGLTTGSHVFLRPGLSPNHGTGARVFRHELAHVLQQTGSRPLGDIHATQPVMGRSGVGLRYDPAQEAAAERVARQVSWSAAARPVDFGSVSAQLPQPSLEGISKRFFDELGADAPLRERVSAIDKGKGGTAKLDKEAEEVARQLPDKLIAEIRTLKTESSKTRFRKPLRAAQAEIVDYVLNNHREAIEKAIRPLVQRSMADRTITTKGAGGKPKQETVWYLRIGDLETELEEYLFGRTGVFFDHEFRTKKAGAGEGSPHKPSNRVIDLDKPIESLSVRSVYLPYVGGTAALWDLVINNTFVKNKPKTFQSKFKNTAEEIARYKGKARIALRAIGPAPGLYKSDEFRFSDKTAEKVENLVHPPSELPANKLPPPKLYTQTKPTSANLTDSALGHIGLRLGLYSEAGGPGSNQYGFERNAHHITQFLVVEYFRNAGKDLKPFKPPLNQYDGLKSAGNEVDLIRGGKVHKDKQIKIGEYYNGRGAKMPTILISNLAHVYGRVHIDGQQPDEDKTKKSRPAGTVHNTFREKLGTEYARIVFAEDGGEALAKIHAGEKVGTVQIDKDALSDRIYEAVCQTYTEMRDEMLRRLERGLKEQEIDYYNEAAENATDPKVKALKLDDGRIALVITAANAHNKEKLEGSSAAGFEERK